jgi:flagellar assembly protein FliH
MMIMSDAAFAKVDLLSALPKSAPFRPLLAHAAHTAPINMAQQSADAFSEGFAAGHRSATEALSEECAQLRALLAKAEALQPEASDAVAALIAETVLRLVTDIVGNAPVDQALLERRIDEAMAVITECDAARNVVLHPDDAALLNNGAIALPIVPDATLARGDLRIECASGSIEHGVSQRLEALYLALGAER